MLSLQIRIFSGQENPALFLGDDQAAKFMELVKAADFNLVDYNVCEEFEENLPLGYQGYTVSDEATGNYWTVYADTVYMCDEFGTHFHRDSAFKLENHLFNCVSDPIIRELAKPTHGEKSLAT